MNPPDQTQATIDTLLPRLAALKHEIAMARQAVQPLEVALAEAFGEFQAAVGRWRRAGLRLQSEIAALRIHHASSEPSEPIEPVGPIDPAPQPGVQPDNQPPPPAANPDAIDKDKLLQHVFNIDLADDDLLATLTGLVYDPATRLVDVLNELPWGPVWQARARQETPAAQLERLQTWERALQRQLAEARQAEARLRSDRRYALYEQRRKGPAAWQQFLDQAAEAQQEDNTNLQAELDELRRLAAQG